jgi:hypothetical protein
MLVAAIVYPSILLAFGLLVGLRTPRMRLALMLLTAVLLITFALYETVLAIWASRCWDCVRITAEHSRGELFWPVSMGLAAALSIFLASIWAGVGLGIFLRRRRATKLAT